MRLAKARGRKWKGISKQKGRILATVKKTEKISWKRLFFQRPQAKNVLTMVYVRRLKQEYLIQHSGIANKAKLWKK